MQEQEPTPFRSLQIAFDPHGLGTHGFVGSCCTTTHIIVTEIHRIEKKERKENSLKLNK